MEKTKELLKKYKEVIMYLIFGVLTTIVNIVAYEIFANVIKIDYLISNAIAWFLSVLFAYITNRIFVFESKTKKIKELIREIASFFGFRLLSGAMDMGFMYLFVTIMQFNDSLMKILVNIIVVILNYIFSKLFIFKK